MPVSRYFQLHILAEKVGDLRRFGTAAHATPELPVQCEGYRSDSWTFTPSWAASDRFLRPPETDPHQHLT